VEETGNDTTGSQRDRNANRRSPRLRVDGRRLRKMIPLNRPEKHGNARAFKISDKLVSMLNRLSKDKKKVLQTA